MTRSFFEQPILNSPYEPPRRHHALSAEGQPLELPPLEGRRKSELISPVPPARNRSRKARQPELGGDEPLHLVLETKGFRGVDAQLKASTMQEMWVPGVNNLGGFGRWAFAEFTAAFAIQDEFDKLIEGLTARKVAA